jgi:hypothetical protein
MANISRRQATQQALNGRRTGAEIGLGRAGSMGLVSIMTCGLNYGSLLIGHVSRHWRN